MTASINAGFYIAPHGIDGEQAGIGFWEKSKLSGVRFKWCTEFLHAHEAVFDASWGGALHDIRTKFTSASGAAIATLSVRNRVASSILLLSDQSPEVDRSVTEMFVESLARTGWVQKATLSARPFASIVSATERPLMVVVAWPDLTISDQEQDVVRELGLHLAGAFLCQNAVSKTSDQL